MKIIVSFLATAFVAAMAFAQEDRGKVVGRVQEAGNVLDQIMAAPDSGIPSNVIESAQCVAVVPSYLKAAFGFSGTYGRGVASCPKRTSTRASIGSLLARIPRPMAK